MGSERVVFTVRGLACGSCALDAGRALRRIPGVVDANLNYMVDTGFVEFDPAVTSWATVARSLENRGYFVVRTPSRGTAGHASAHERQGRKPPPSNS